MSMMTRTLTKMSLGSFATSRNSGSSDEVEKASTWFEIAVTLSTSSWVAWTLAVTVALVLSSTRYYFEVIDQNRLLYVSSGAALWAQAEANRTLLMAMHARDALQTNIHRGVVAGLGDVAAVEKVFAPIFSDSPEVNSIELAFSNRPEVLLVSHAGTADGGRLQVQMQSNAANCFLLGIHGCRNSGVVAGEKPTWWYALNGGDDPDTDASRWSDEPEFVAKMEATESGGDTVAWVPAYRMLFRFVFQDAVEAIDPIFFTPMLEDLVVIGRITIGLGGLSGARLQDSDLGEKGRIYLCDRSGFVIAAKVPFDTLKMTQQTLRFRSVWEVQDITSNAASWLKETFGAGPGGMTGQCVAGTHGCRHTQYETGELVVVSWLLAPLDDFAIVLWVPSNEPFADTSLVLVSWTGFAVTTVPYLVFLSFIIYIIVKQWTKISKEETKRTSARMKLVKGATTMSRSLSRKGSKIFGGGAKSLARGKSYFGALRGHSWK